MQSAWKMFTAHVGSLRREVSPDRTGDGACRGQSENLCEVKRKDSSCILKIGLLSR